MSNFKGMKFRIQSESHSKRIQECLFAIGYIWVYKGKVHLHTRAPFLFTTEKGGILYGSVTSDFLTDPCEEKTLEDLETMLNESQVISTFNPETSMTQFFQQLQKRLGSVECSLTINPDSIEVSTLDTGDIATMNSYEELVSVLETREKYLKTFKEPQ